MLCFLIIKKRRTLKIMLFICVSLLIFSLLLPTLEAKGLIVMSAHGGGGRTGKGQAIVDNTDYLSFWLPTDPGKTEVSTEFAQFLESASIGYADKSDALYFSQNPFEGTDSDIGNVCSEEINPKEILEIDVQKDSIPDKNLVTVYYLCSSYCCTLRCCKPNMLFWLSILLIMLICATLLVYLSFKRNIFDLRTRIPFVRVLTRDHRGQR